MKDDRFRMLVVDLEEGQRDMAKQHFPLGPTETPSVCVLGEFALDETPAALERMFAEVCQLGENFTLSGTLNCRQPAWALY